ncbi:carbohydrate-binding protein [Paractinoplanes rhizophilus]|uniref:Carbohydrate-binding protein n=1 Tax=Paractinoplanes rhizophilus TaxID=1416877 RepID=A0ABW2I092_9ACTN
MARHRSGTSTWRVRPRAVAALAVATAGLSMAIWLPGRGDVASADVQRGRPAQFGRSVFEDDFAGHRLDFSKWTLLRDDGAPANGGARVQDGELQVDRLLRSKQRFTDAFGHAEARVKVRRQNGVWRAFAVLDENGRVPRGTLETIDGGIDPTSGRRFHTYAIDWTPEAVVWTVDGKPSLRLVREDEGGPLTLVLNLATDGRSASRMLVDFVQVFTNSSAPPTADPSAPEPSPSAPGEPTASSPAEPPASSPAEPTPSKSATTPAATAWAAFTNYTAGDLVTFEGATYRVLEDHTSLPGWEPTKLPNLFAKL